MARVDDRVGPRLEAERGGTFVRAEREQRIDRDDATLAGLAARDAFELAQLFERVDAHVRVGADAHADPPMAHPCDRQEAVAEVRLGRRADADARARVAEQVELAAVCMRGVHDRRPRPEAAFA